MKSLEERNEQLEDTIFLISQVIEEGDMTMESPAVTLNKIDKLLKKVYHDE